VESLGASVKSPGADVENEPELATATVGTMQRRARRDNWRPTWGTDRVVTTQPADVSSVTAYQLDL